MNKPPLLQASLTTRRLLHKNTSSPPSTHTHTHYRIPPAPCPTESKGSHLYAARGLSEVMVT
jgi:hypothetical protein